MADVAQRLNDDCGSDSKFHRPPAKTDRLFAVLERGTDPVLVKHPVPAPGREHLYRENLPNIRCGSIASGRVVARKTAWRTEVKQKICEKSETCVGNVSVNVYAKFRCALLRINKALGILEN